MELPSVLSPSALARPARFVAPDHSERKGDRELLVWRDPPQWIVVESETAQFLRALDGNETPGAAAARMQLGRLQVVRLRRLLADLERRGLIRSLGRRSAAAPKIPEPKLPLIENVTVHVTPPLEPGFGASGELRGSASAPGSEVSTREVISLFESAPYLFARNATLVLAGGEPLLRPDFVLEIAAWAAKRFAQTIVSTSAEFLTDDFTKKAARGRLQVEVRLEGPSAESHDAIRGGGSFERATAEIRKLVSRGVHTILNCAVDARNLPDIERFYDLAVRSGAQEVRLVRIKWFSPASGRARPSLLELLREVRETFVRRPELAVYGGRDECSAFVDTCLRSVRRKSCGSGLRRFLIDSEGALYPCAGAWRPEFRIASMRGPAFDFEQIWKSSLFLAEYRSKTSVERENGGCSECEVGHFCLGGCRGETYAIAGRLEERSPWCKERRAAVLETLWSLSERPVTFPEGAAYC